MLQESTEPHARMHLPHWVPGRITFAHAAVVANARSNATDNDLVLIAYAARPTVSTRLGEDELPREFGDPWIPNWSIDYQG